jgi:sulfide:quinone oxidoreductase
MNSVNSPEGHHKVLIVGGGRAPQRASVRPQSRVMPNGVTWIQGAAAAVDPAAQRVTTESGQVLGYDIMHVTPPQSAPDWVKASPLADPASPFGYVRADKHTLRHPEWPNVFSLGDVANLPTSKTGAAIRKQSPVVAANLLAAMHGGGTRSYDGYTSCPLVTSRNKVLLAEFNYDLEPAPSLPFIDTLKPRRDMYLLKRYGLPALYWQGMLKGRA